ncbi:MAG: ISAs1 family transposase [Kiritimatiellae bacterium]|nr:ISAs1 family transposase [Kiritimatiellia bacterium]
MKTKEIWREFADAEALARIEVGLIEPEEHDRWNLAVDENHYLSSLLVGPTLRYAAKLDGEWVGVLSFGQAAYHIRDRDEWIGWNDVQRGRRLSMIAQNTRFVLLHERGTFPNLASRILSIILRRLSEDWMREFGNPIVAVETFVDPERFSGSCYAASGWTRLGETSGFKRSRKDFYEKHNRPKELWGKSIDRRGFRSLKSKRLPTRLRVYETEWRTCPFTDKAIGSLFDMFQGVRDLRTRKGRRYRTQTMLAIFTLAAVCGYEGSRAIASFAKKLTPKQRRRLRCWRNPQTREHTAPSETCIRNFAYKADVEQIENILAMWMNGLDPNELNCIAVDGKTLKGTAKRNENGEKKGALHLVSAVAHHNARMLAQESVKSKSNEIPAVQRILHRFPHLNGITITGDALNAQQETARIIVQEKGGPITYD